MGATDVTQPPAQGLVCPICRRPFDAAEASYAADLAAAVPRCPEHGVAYVEAGELSVSEPDPLLGQTVAERFTVLSRLGSGSMGEVYRARQEAVGRDVALKIVHPERAYDPETRKRFEQEARATSALVSAHTVTVFDFGEAGDGSWFLAMELLQGESLGQRLNRVRRIPVADALRFTREALVSLSEAHGKGIVHRDLKPDNLFLSKQPEAADGDAEICKVLDFGIAKVMHVEKKIDQLETQAGTVFGTPRYMSPEQAQGNALDARSDLYSLGVILYQMLSGRAPFVDDDAVVVMAKHIKEEPPVFSEIAPDASVPPLIERVVRRMLAKDPEDRPQDAEQLSAALTAASKESGVLQSGVHEAAGTSSVRNAIAALPLIRPSLKRKLAIGAGIAALVGVFAAGYWVFRPTGDNPPVTAEPPPEPARRAAPAVAATPEVTAEPESSEQAPAPPSAEAPATEVPTPKTPSTRRPRPVKKPAALPKPVLKPAAPAAPPKKKNERYGRFE